MGRTEGEERNSRLGGSKKRTRGVLAGGSNSRKK